MPPNAEIDPQLGPVTDPPSSTESNVNLKFSIYLQIDWEGNGSVDHTAVVTKKDSNNRLYLTYHSHSRLDKPFTEIQLAYPMAKYYAWKLK